MSIFSFIICVCSHPLFRGPAFGSLFWKYEWWCATPSKRYGISCSVFFCLNYYFIVIILFLKSYLLKLFGVSFYKYKYNAPVCTYWRSLLIDSWRICFPFICLFLCLPSHLSLLSLYCRYSVYKEYTGLLYTILRSWLTGSISLEILFVIFNNEET